MRTSRRGFLKTLGGVALFSIVPRHVLGNGYIAPSDQLTKGIIGTGGMGRGHVNYAGTRLVAVCDVDKNHLELGKKLVKEKIAAYHDFRDLILDPNVDIVHIATPPHWHGIMSVEAAKAGKVVNCLLQLHIAEEETKFGFSFGECREMLAAGEWKTLSNIQLCGLMGMATNTDDNEQIEKEFCSLSSFFKEVKDSWFADTEAFRELSMGMSHDYHQAIAAGSTLIRVGSKIFGDRTY